MTELIFLDNDSDLCYLICCAIVASANERVDT